MKKFAIPLLNNTTGEPELLEVIENHDGKLIVKFGEYAMTVKPETLMKELVKSGFVKE